ncbi:hypothetical protein BVRB_2g024490 [Beta vulgaris subsp. vulgaris]|nr:hypothetical protein BVRB_2g024490 [Beta vulgaris subsp. vulgaris]
MVSLKIFVDTKNKKVVFAEAGKEFIDFILDMLSLPLSIVAKLLKEHNESKVGCIGALYHSIEALSPSCFESDSHKGMALKPRTNVVIPLLSCYEGRSGQQASLQPTNYPSYGRKFVKEAISFIVMDNLEVKPMSATLIKSIVNDFDILTEQEVQVGCNEGLDLLKASLESQTVLSTVFLWNKK